MSVAKKEVVVVGAGISGLTTAYYLRRQGADVTVFDSQDRAGGYLASKQESGYLFEQGPNTVMARPSLAKLIEDLKLQASQIIAKPESKKRFVFLGGKLRSIVPNPPGLLRTSILSWPGKLRALMEPFVAQSTEDEETVEQFFRRRFGREVVNNLVEPMVTGIFAGDIGQMSLAAAFPKLNAWEKQYGSILKAVTKQKRAKPPKLISFKRGLSELIDALGDNLLDSLQLNQAVRSIEKINHGFRLSIGSEEGRHWLECQRLVLATGAPTTAKLLQNFLPLASDILNTIPMASLSTVLVGFRQQDIPRPIDGFGMLIPKSENRQLLGVLFTSSLFDGRCPEDMVALTCMIGGQKGGLAGALDETAVRQILKRDLKATLQITAEPQFFSHQHWPKAIPQYALGHTSRMFQLHNVMEQVSGLHFTGNYIDGISLPHCIERAQKLAEELHS